MDQNAIDNLREALKLSPDNIPLKYYLAQTLQNHNRLDEAETEYYELIRLSSDIRFKIGLANIFYVKNEFSKCIVILEELTDKDLYTVDSLVLYAKALQKEGSVSEAIQIYKKVLELNPGFTDEELDTQLRLTSVKDLTIENIPDDSDYFLQKPEISFEDVGGMADVKKEIELKIIKPLLHPELYKAYGKKTGGGILLYGPPGCGKTFLAKATAGQINAKFISVSLNDILDMWIGNSEKNLHDIFEIARRNTPCVLFFDEIDALGASRSDMKQSAGRHIINQFLQELDGINSSNEGVLILGATNTPWHLDAAFRRPGRFDRIIFVSPPDELARERIIQLKLEKKPVENPDVKKVAQKTEHYSGADLEAVIDIATEIKLEESFLSGIPAPITTADLLNAVRKHKPSTQEWFSKAKNFALFANESGLYDEILKYMKIKK